MCIFTYVYTYQYERLGSLSYQQRPVRQDSALNTI